MNEAMDKLREAVGRVDSDLANGCNQWRPLVVELVNTAKAVLASAPVALTEAERATVAQCRAICDYTAYGGSVRAMLAIIDRIAPKPEPEHKPCPFCGGKPARGAGPRIYCLGCGAEAFERQTEAEAWAAWDRRAEVKP